MYRIRLLVALWAVALGCLLAQTPTGTIQGIITDSSGGVVPGARVVIINTATDEAVTLTTDHTGRYARAYLPPGTYVIKVESEGFQTIVQENIRLDVSQNRSVDLVVRPGLVSQEIRVEAAPPPVDVNTSSLGQVIENKRIMDLPLNGRGVFNLASLTPGVNPTGGGATPGMGGGRNSMSELQIDGMTNIAPENNVGVNNRIYEPQVDSVQEFSVQVNALAAEYGRFSGGVINVVTKSGTNRLHGTAYEYIRNPVLNANGFINNRNGVNRSGSKQNQYGFTVGGPIYIPKVIDGRNKSFFFADFEKSATRSTSTWQGTVPLPEWKAGDFSNLKTAAGAPITMYDPLTGHSDPANPGKFIREAFPGNRIPADRMDPVAKNMLIYYPEPNRPPLNPHTQQNNFLNTGPSASNSSRTNTRWDHNWTDNWRMFARVSFAWDDNNPFNRFGNDGTSGSGPASGRTTQVSIDHTYTISPTLVANLRYGFGRTAYRQLPFSDGLDLAALGFPASYAQTAAMSGLEFPNVGLSSNLSLTGLGQGGLDPLLATPHEPLPDRQRDQDDLEALHQGRRRVPRADDQLPAVRFPLGQFHLRPRLDTAGDQHRQFHARRGNGFVPFGARQGHQRRSHGTLAHGCVH